MISKFMRTHSFLERLETNKLFEKKRIKLQNNNNTIDRNLNKKFKYNSFF